MDAQKEPLVLVILDGWGYSRKTTGDAISKAHTPVFDMFVKNYPMVLLQASGLGTGMTWGEPGNSEVGHMNLGTGRIVRQYRARVQEALKDGSFFKNPAFLGAFEYADKNKSTLNLIGLLTSGTVHADFEHLCALLKIAGNYKNLKVNIHLFLDGRDSGLQEAKDDIKKLEQRIKDYKVEAVIQTAIGRFYGMDRNKNWPLTQKAFNLIVKGEGEKTSDFISTLKEHYQKDESDTNMPAIVRDSYQGMGDNEAIIFFNYREDSMRQIFKAFTDPNFSEFKREIPSGLHIASMTKYSDEQKEPAAFDPPKIKNCLAEVLSNAGLKQLHIAETQKFAHVTYFFNGLTDKRFPNEEHILIKSPNNPIDEPEMRAVEIAKKVQEVIDKNLFDFIVINIANADFIAHTGDFNATVKAIEAADKALEIIYNAVIHHNGSLMVTGDHGNAEQMIYRETGKAESKHNQSPVYFIIIRKEYAIKKSSSYATREVANVSGVLGDVAPTILDFMGIPKPPEMAGHSLLNTFGLKR